MSSVLAVKVKRVKSEI